MTTQTTETEDGPAPLRRGAETEQSVHRLIAGDGE